MLPKERRDLSRLHARPAHLRELSPDSLCSEDLPPMCDAHGALVHVLALAIPVRLRGAFASAGKCASPLPLGINLLLAASQRASVFGTQSHELPLLAAWKEATV